ncbi:GFA family protein [Taklimakanibacter lacteus]|uniref:GFA family protein n=1 Tax=Taklimakanibacter lacteus TaxID=2268456 RepID=UPI000E671A62
MRYKGSCHCGKVTFEVKGDVAAGAIACNCSICSRKGALLIAVPRNDLSLLSPETDLQKYTFNKHAIAHRFCRTCGMHPFAEDTAERLERLAYVNIRCLHGIDIAKVPVVEFDGRVACRFAIKAAA